MRLTACSLFGLPLGFLLKPNQMNFTLNKTFKSSRLYVSCENALSLILNGNEKRAKEELPMEYHFIKKYAATNNDELISVFTKKVELH